MTAQPSYLGASVQRVEDRRLLTGQGQYVADLQRPGLVDVAFVRSTFAHARLRRVDTAAAAAKPGVVAVLTAADLAGLRPIVADNRTPGYQRCAWPAVARDVVRYAGEIIAVVVAESRYAAEDAAELVEVEYEPLPVLTDPLQAIAAGAPPLHPGWKDNVYLRRTGLIGDVEGVFRSAHLVLRRTYRTQRHTGVPMEPRGYLAEWDRRTQQLTLWGSTQIPFLIRTAVADALTFPEHRLRVVAPDVGGGFGIKCQVYPEEILVSHLALRLRRPVRWIADRREDLLASNHARDHLHEVEVAAAADGTILGLKARIIVNVGAYAVWPWTAAMEAGMAVGNLPGPYKIRNFAFDALSVATNLTPLGAYRGVARPSACFTIERAVDDVARALGLDPAEVRMRNLIDSYPYTTATGLVVDSGSLKESLAKCLEVLDYRRLREEQAAARRKGRYLGVGLANYTEQTAHASQEFAKRGVPVTLGFESATVRMDPSGKVTVIASIASHGQGLETTLAQLAASALGIRTEDVTVIHGDTAAGAYGMGTFASRSAVIGGGAVLRAAAAVRRKLSAIAARLLEASAEDVEPVEGGFQVRGVPGRRLDLRELARVAYHRTDVLGDLEPGLEATASFDHPPGTGTFSNAIHAAWVEVDPHTGEVRILRYVVVDDCGVIVNPAIVAGQVRGGVAQGLGGALWEHLLHDENGQLVTGTLMDYLLPGCAEVPRVEVHHLVTPSPYTEEGIKGMGEGGAIAPGAAIANAVTDALAPLGVAIDETPVAPPALLGAIRAARERGLP